MSTSAATPAPTAPAATPTSAPPCSLGYAAGGDLERSAGHVRAVHGDPHDGQVAAQRAPGRQGDRAEGDLPGAEHPPEDAQAAGWRRA
ncbi:hypothetical protein G5V59_04425 [Nocardioides sp. W3-2-3]|nr:hypothetical protein [Nocardioides convexus]